MRRLPVQVVRIIDPEFTRNGNQVYTSLEGHQPGGSIKDHLVLGELQELVERGEIRRGHRIAEMSAGSTALSLSHYCRELGLGCVLFVPDTIEPALLSRLEESCEVHKVALARAVEEFDRYCSRNRVRPFDQMSDETKKRHYEHLAGQVAKSVEGIDRVIGAVGTGHSLRGIGEYLGAPTVSAEPEDYPVSGVRNIETQRFGERDPTRPAWFDARVLISRTELYPANEIECDRGRIRFSDSFRLALSACLRIVEGASGRKIFLIGAKNVLVGSK